MHWDWILGPSTIPSLLGVLGLGPGAWYHPLLALYPGIGHLIQVQSLGSGNVVAREQCPSCQIYGLVGSPKCQVTWCCGPDLASGLGIEHPCYSSILYPLGAIF